MKKKIASLILAFTLLISALIIPVNAYTEKDLRTADALFSLGLFLGTGTTYALDHELTREQGITLLVRMLGKEEEAQSGYYSHPFTDVSEWADGYVGYCYTNNITNGTSPKKFSGASTMTDQMFLTLCIRAIGYTDSGDNKDFTYEMVWPFACELGLIPSTQKDTTFTRGETVEIFWNLLNTKMKNSEKTLAENLISQNVFTADEWEKAVLINSDGKTEGDTSGEKNPTTSPDDKPKTPDTPSEPTQPTTPTEPIIPPIVPGTDETEPFFPGGLGEDELPIILA